MRVAPFFVQLGVVMQLAILHFHLNRGGVTQVIQNHLRALAVAPGTVERVVVFYGGRRQGWPDDVLHSMLHGAPLLDVQLVAVPELEYDESPHADPDRLAAALRRAFDAAGLDRDRTVLHIHNHALGKNASMPGALVLLAADGFRQLLQVHDFAEDFRPDNYRHLSAALGEMTSGGLAAKLYPQAAGIHYAVLNRRDHGAFSDAGIAAERLHLLPNPVAEFLALSDRAEARRAVAQQLQLEIDEPLVVYPVRGIRRKNVGELLLTAALDRRNGVYAITLAPLNPVEAASFNEWQRLAEQLGLRCRFDVGGGGGLPFVELLAAADRLITTSVAEGFGMVFLEAWLAGRPLVGRNLPEITADFVEQGIAFDPLYDRLAVPLELIDARQARDELAATYRAVCGEYGQSAVEGNVLERQIDELIVDNTIDFACLDSKLQQSLIERVVEDRVDGERLLAANPRLAVAIEIDEELQAETIARNAEHVRQRYSLKAAGGQLVKIYQAILAGETGDNRAALPHGQAILQSFLDVRRLHPIRLTSP